MQVTTDPLKYDVILEALRSETSYYFMNNTDWMQRNSSSVFMDNIDRICLLAQKLRKTVQEDDASYRETLHVVREIAGNSIVCMYMSGAYKRDL